MIIKCPKCGSEDFDIPDMEYSWGYDNYYCYCYCEDCGAEFEIEYRAVDIKLKDKENK